MEEGKKKGKFKILLLIIICLIVIGVGGFFLYDKVLKDKIDTKEEKENKEVKDKEENKEDEFFEIDEGYYIGYYYADEYEETPEDGYFLVQCGVENDCKSLAKLGFEIEPIGLYKERYYYQYSEGKTVYVNYIDFNDNCKINKWISFDTDDWEETENTANIINAVFDDNKIIFNLERNIAGHSNLDGILSIDLSAKSIADSKVLDKYGTDFVFDKDNKIIYYEFFDNINNGDDPEVDPFSSINKYDIKTGKVNKLFDVDYEDNVSMFFVRGHLLFSSETDKKVYDVDPNTGKKNDFYQIKSDKYQTVEDVFNVFYDNLYVLEEDALLSYDFTDNEYKRIVEFSPSDEFSTFEYFSRDLLYIGSEKDYGDIYLYKEKNYSELPVIKVEVEGKKLNFDFDCMDNIF